MRRPAEDYSGADPADWIERNAREHPGRVFLRTPDGRELTYTSLVQESAQVAAALRQCGVGSGDRVLARTDKSPAAIVLYIACLRTGAVFVPANVAGTPNEFEHLLRDSAPVLAVIPGAQRAALAPLAARAGLTHLETLEADGTGSFADLARGADTTLAPARPFDRHALAAIVYTSGTTGRPKGAMLTRTNLASNAEVLVRAWRFRGVDVLLHALPLFHVHGLFVTLNTVLAAGAGVLLLPKFDAGMVLRYLPEVTVFMGVPTHYTRLLQEEGLGHRTSARMRLFVSGSAPLSPETHQAFAARTGYTILERYGMTETLMNTSNPYDGPRVPGSVGTPLEGVRLRLAHGEAGAGFAAGSIGALEVTGPNVFAGYWRDEEKTRGEFTADGWFRTGDLGRIDPAGYVYIVGRAKDLVISGGYNVYPKEVESELDAYPGVAESAVFGVPHPDFGEGVTAVVVLKAGAHVSEADLIAAVRLRLSGYKVPKRVVLVAELPRNALGKVRKDTLRKDYAQLYASS